MGERGALSMNHESSSASFIQAARLAAAAGCLLLAAGVRAQSPTTGFAEYAGHFKVQKPYDLPLDSRFSDSGGMYTAWVYPNDKPFEQGNTTEPRTEMRWDTWTNQNVDNMWEADVMYESGCARTCIMQVKSNTSGEAVYMRVLAGGDLTWLGTSSPTLLKGYYGKWFNLKAAFNPATATARVWIDDQLKYTHRYNNARDWYFKNGTYTVEGTGPARAHFKNIKLRVYAPGGSWLSPLPGPILRGRPSVLYDAQGRLAWVNPGAARPLARQACFSLPAALPDP